MYLYVLVRSMYMKDSNATRRLKEIDGERKRERDRERQRETEREGEGELLRILLVAALCENICSLKRMGIIDPKKNKPFELITSKTSSFTFFAWLS